MTPACPDLDEPVICYYQDLAFLMFDIRDPIVFFHEALSVSERKLALENPQIRLTLPPRTRSELQHLTKRFLMPKP